MPPQNPSWWESVWETVVDAVIIIDENGIIEDCNYSIETVFGYDRPDVVGRNISILIPDLHRVVHQDGMKAYATHLKDLPLDRSLDLIARREDGSVFPIRLMAGEFSVSGRCGYTCIVRDISVRRKIEDRLRQREEQLKLTIQHAPTGIATVDLEGRFRTVNDAFSAMVGYTEAELTHRPVNSITHPDDIELAEKRLRELREGEIDQYRMRKRYIKKSGAIVEAVLSASVVHDSEGKPLLYVAQMEDLTERLKIEKDASEVREKLAHVTRVHMIGEMAAGIAHEINQPLTAIATYAQASRHMIEAGMDKSEEVLAAMDKISRQARRAGEVITSLRGLIRKRSSMRKTVDPGELIREVARLAEMDARLRETTIKLDLDDDLPCVLADPVQIQQVILNLLLNGMEAMERLDCSDKSLTVTARSAASNSVQISVKDQGVGISEEAEGRLFQTFFTTKKSGMGMGLVICRSILNSHGGSLWFTTNPDRGATFSLSMPAAVGESNE